MKSIPGIFALMLFFTFLLAENKEALIKELEEGLMASCFHGTVANHGDAKMEAKIRELVNEGKTKQEVMDYYVAIYGERILASPVARGFNLMAWLAPIAVFLLGLLVFVNYLKHKPREPASETVTSESQIIPYDDIIERELKEME